MWAPSCQELNAKPGLLKDFRSLCEVGARIPIFTAEETEVQRGAVAFPSSDSGDEERLSFGLRSVGFRSPGPPGLFVSRGACCQGAERGSCLCRVPGRVIGSGAVLGQGPEEALQGRMGSCELQERTQKPLSSRYIFSFLSPGS